MSVCVFVCRKTAWSEGENLELIPLCRCLLVGPRFYDKSVQNDVDSRKHPVKIVMSL